MTRILWIFQALFLGAKLKNSATWKTWGTFIAVVAPLLALIGKVASSYGWLPAEFTKEEIDAFAQWVWQGSGILLAYWFQATSTDVGIGKEQEIGYQVTEPYEELGPETAGVLYHVPSLRVQARGKADLHPGDDPGLDSFNR